MSGKQNGFSKIPLARKIEALVLTAVTVIASMSVDWSSLTARAEAGDYQYTLSTENPGTITSVGETILITITGDGNVNGDTTQPYMTLLASYMNLRVTGGSAHFYVDVYQFPSTASDYTDEASIKNGGTLEHVYNDTISNTSFRSTLILNQNTFPVYLANGEHATIVVTFDELSDGATVEYGQDTDGNGIEVETGYSATSEDITLTSDVDKFVLTIGTTPDTPITYADKFHWTPAYERDINRRLYGGTETAFNALDESAKQADATYSSTGTQQVNINSSTGELSAGFVNGVNTLVVSSSINLSDWLKIPIYVVDPGVTNAAGTNIFDNLKYTGTAVTNPRPVCTNGPTLTEETNYTVRFTGSDNFKNVYSGNAASDIKNAGSYTVTITGSGAYEGLYYTRNFDIAQKNLGNLTPVANQLTINPNDLSVSKDAGVLTDTIDGQSYTLVYGKDYTATVTRNTTTEGQYDVTLTGMGNYTGTATTTTNLSSNTEDNPGDLSAMVSTMQILDSATSGSAIYTYDAQGHKDLSFNFYDVNGAKLNLTLHKDYEYTITSKSTNQPVYYSETDRAANYDGAISAGDYLVTVRGKGAYSGNVTSDEKNQTFRINARTLTKNNIKVYMNPTTLNYTGAVCFPTTVTLQYRNGSTFYDMTSADFDAAPADASTDSGTHAVKITGKGNFTGTVDFSNSTKAEAKSSSQTDDQYAAYLDANENLVYPTSIVTYDIISNLESAQIYLADDVNSFSTTYADKAGSWKSDYTTVYNGQAKKPAVKVVLDGKELKQRTVNGSTNNDSTADYRVIYPTEDNIKAGTATLKIKGMNTFANAQDIEVTFTITPKSLTSLPSDAFTINGTQTYGMKNGKIKLPADPITLSSTEAVIKDGSNTLDVSSSETGDGDYYLTYENNTDASTSAVVVAHGINNYGGEIRKTFTINPLAMTPGSGFAVAPINPQTFTGMEIKPDSEVKVTYADSTNGLEDAFTIVGYKDNINVGDTATVTVQGKGNFTGTLTGTFKIVNKSLLGITFKLGGKTGKLDPITNSHYEVDYTGNVVKPPLTLTDGLYQLKSTDYQLSYDYDASQGEKSIKITGIGNYAGTSAILKFTVNPVTLKNIKLVSVKTSASLDASKVLTTGTEIKRYYQVQLGNKVLTPGVTTSSDFTFRWTAPGETTAMPIGQIPTKAGTGYTLEITGRNNYEGTIAITQDSTKQSLMVGASLDVNNIIKVYGSGTADGTGQHSLGYLGNNMPPADISGTGTVDLTKGSLNTNIDVDSSVGALSGPTYSAGTYDNTGATDYTVHFISTDGATEYTTFMEPGTVFKVRVDAKEGSTKYFGSHTTSDTFKVTPGNLTALQKSSGDVKTQVTVKDTNTTNASKTSYVISGGTVDTTDKGLSYEYTGGDIAPSLSVVIEPSYNGFNGTLNSIDLANYGKTQSPATISGSAVTASGSNPTIAVSAARAATGNTSYFTGSVDVPYAVTAYELQPTDITLGTLSLTYDGTSHEEAIKKAVHVKVKGATLDSSKYTVEFYTDSDCNTKADDSTNKGFTNAGNIYVKITAISDKSIALPTDGNGVTASGNFTIAPRNLSNVTFTPADKSSGTAVAMLQKEGVYAIAYSSNMSAAGNITALASDSVTITENDYTITPPTTLVLGANTISIEGTGNYTGSRLVNFYIYGQLSDSSSMTNRFNADTDLEDGDTFTLNANGQAVNDRTSAIFDARGITFESPDSNASVYLSGSDLDVTIIDPDRNITTTMATPGKKKITFKGRGVTQKCDTTSSQSFTVTVYGDAQNFTIKGLATDYDFKGDTNGKGVDPVDHSKLSVQLNGSTVPASAYTLTVEPADGASSEFLPKSGTTDDAFVKVEINTTNNTTYYKNSGAAKTQYFNIRYNLKNAVISSSQTEAFTMDQNLEDIKNTITVTLQNKTLTADTDYTLDAAWTSSGNNQAQGSATLTITASPDANKELSYNFVTKKYAGNKKQITDSMVTWPSELTAEYDGNDHKADFSAVTIDGLTEGTDYTISWMKVDDSGNETAVSASAAIKDAGKYKAYINGVGDYYADPRPSKEFTITARDLSNSTMALVDENVKYYSGADPAAKYTVTDNTLGVLTEKTDYTIARTAPTAGAATDWAVNTSVTYTVTGTGNYKGTISDTFQILKADLSKDGVIEVTDDEATYDGQKHGPEFKVFRGTTELKRGTDYTMTPTEGSVDAGTYTYTITGQNNYENTKEITFTIKQRDLSKATFELKAQKHAWTGAQVKPEYTVADTVSGSSIIKDSDYTVSYANNIDSYKLVDDDTTDASAPAVVFTADASGNYTGTVTRHFQIGSDIADAEVTLETPTSREYSSTTPFRPNVTKITFNGNDYTSSSSPKLSDVATWSYETEDGTAITSTSEPKNAGTYKVLVTGKGPFFGTNDSETFEITANEAEKKEINVEIVRDASSGQMKDSDGFYYYYTGEEIRPKVKVTYTPIGSNRGVVLTESTTDDHTDGDYYLDYRDNTDVGDATIDVILINNYVSSQKAHAYFEIRGLDISKYKVRVKGGGVEYTGEELKPDYIVTATDGTKYDSSDLDDATALENLGITAEYTNNIAPGTGNITLSGSGNSSGTTATATFDIYADLSEDVTSITPAKVFRTGSALSPAVTLHFVDKDGNDHPIASTSNWFRTRYRADTGNWATATKINVTITPTSTGDDYLTDEYKGTIELTTVPPNLTIDGYQPTYQYTGTKINPSGLTVKSDGEALPSGATVSFSFNSSRDGSACVLPGTVTITATVTYGGQTATTKAGKYSTESKEKPATFTIVPRPIKACVFQGPSDSRYTGSAITPIFSINTGYAQLRSGSDYTYTVRNNVKPGNAIVTITGRGNYIGTTTKAFHIYVAPVTGLSASNKSGTTAVIRWRRSGTADGYRVTYTSSTGVRKMLITSPTASNYKLTDLRSGTTQVLVEAYVSSASGRPMAYSSPASVIVR